MYFNFEVRRANNSLRLSCLLCRVGSLKPNLDSHCAAVFSSPICGLGPPFMFLWHSHWTVGILLRDCHARLYRTKFPRQHFVQSHRSIIPIISGENKMMDYVSEIFMLLDSCRASLCRPIVIELDCATYGRVEQRILIPTSPH